MKKKLFYTLLGVLMALPALARDFEYTYEGQTLTYTVIDEDAKTCMTKEGGWLGSYSFAGNKVSGELIIPEIAIDGDVEYSVTEIGNNAFISCQSLTSVTIPNSVTKIGGDAFYECGGLTSVTIPNSVTEIGAFAFSYCNSLINVSLPTSVSNIGGRAFHACSNLKSLVVPDATMGEAPFSACDNLIKIAVTRELDQTYNEKLFGSIKNLYDVCIIYFDNLNSRIEDGVVFSRRKDHIYFAPVSLSGNYTLPETVETIEECAFFDCSGLTSLTLNDALTSIGEGAFAYCSGLTSLTLNDALPSIGAYAFAYCDGLTSLTLNDALTSIGEGAFGRCSGLTSLTLNDALTSIGDEAFAYCSGLTSLTLNDALTSIGDYAFAYCDGLTSLTLNDALTSIGDYAFTNCGSLTEVQHTAVTPIETSTTIFDKNVYDHATLRVPQGAIKAFEKTAPWSYFYDIVEGIHYDNDASIGVVTIATDELCDVYSTGGILVKRNIKLSETTSLNPGIYIVRQGNAVSKISVQ